MRISTLQFKQLFNFLSDPLNRNITSIISKNIKLFHETFGKFFIFWAVWFIRYSFVDKNKNIKKPLAANFESLADKITENLDSHKQEDFHEFLRAGIYKVTADNTLDDLKTFKSFLFATFMLSTNIMKKMLPKPNQPGQLYGTTKTHTFSSIEDTTLENLKFRPIIAQSGTFTCNAAQVITDYLKPLCSDNKYIIRNTQDFPKLLQQQNPLLPNEEYMSYDVKSLFTNVPIQETFDYILDGIYVKNKLAKIYSKLIFKCLLLKLTTEDTFMFTPSFYKQIDGCTMGEPLSVMYEQNRT